jgi:hypothetical protein
VRLPRPPLHPGLHLDTLLLQWRSGWLRWTWCGTTATPAAVPSGRG